MKNTPVNIFWFRRDLRLNDNHGLYQALRDKNPVVPVFIFDKNIYYFRLFIWVKTMESTLVVFGKDDIHNIEFAISSVLIEFGLFS